MKKNTKIIRLSEANLNSIVKNTIKSVLREEFGRELDYGNDHELDNNKKRRDLYDEIDSRLQKFGDAYVSRFYSDKNQITLAVHKSINMRNKIQEMMSLFGFELYTIGANDDYIIMTFIPK